MQIRRLLDNHQQKIRFGTVGILNTAVDFGFYALLSSVISLPFIFANFISTSLGFMVSFFLNRRFTFNSHNSRKLHEFLRFLTTTLVGLWILQPVVIYICKASLQSGNIHGVIPFIAPKLFAIGVGLIWNYCWYSRFVFARNPITVATIAQRVTRRLTRISR